MFEELDSDDLYAELIMLRANDTRAFILVEGSTDCAVLDRFVNQQEFITVPTQGKVRAHGALERVHSRGELAQIYAILDRDWVGLLDDGLDHDAVVYTDFYDLDACIFFAAGVYESLAANFCTNAEFRFGRPGCKHEDIASSCLELALPVGMLRFISHRDGLGLNLRDFPLSKAATRAGMDLPKLIQLACQRAGKDPADHPHLLGRLRQELGDVVHASQYCSGHDLAKAFALISKRKWASKAGHDIIERSARAAFGYDAFTQSAIFTACGHWCTDDGTGVWSPRAS